MLSDEWNSPEDAPKDRKILGKIAFGDGFLEEPVRWVPYDKNPREGFAVSFTNKGYWACNDRSIFISIVGWKELDEQESRRTKKTAQQVAKENGSTS